jgi:hypothetical protein
MCARPASSRGRSGTRRQSVTVIAADPARYPTTRLQAPAPPRARAMPVKAADEHIRDLGGSPGAEVDQRLRKREVRHAGNAEHEVQTENREERCQPALPKEHCGKRRQRSEARSERFPWFAGRWLQLWLDGHLDSTLTRDRARRRLPQRPPRVASRSGGPDTPGARMTRFDGANGAYVDDSRASRPSQRKQGTPQPQPQSSQSRHRRRSRHYEPRR